MPKSNQALLPSEVSVKRYDIPNTELPLDHLASKYYGGKSRRRITAMNCIGERRLA